MAKMQLQICLATGRSWFGKFQIAPEGIGSSVVIYGEETVEELQYRLYYICEHMKLTPKEIEKVERRVFMYSAVDAYYLPILNKKGHDEASPTDFVDKLLETVNQLDDLVFVGIDPLAKYYGGGIADNKDAYRFTSELKRIATAKGCTVLVLNHVNKSGLKDGASPEAAGFGSVAFRDSSRVMLNMTQMTARQVKDYDEVKENEYKLYVKLSLTKGNYTAPQSEEWWLKRCDYGVLEYANLTKNGKELKTNTDWMFILSYIKKGVENGQRYGKTDLLTAAISTDSGKPMTKQQKTECLMGLLNDGKLTTEMIKIEGNNKPKSVFVIAPEKSVTTDEDVKLAEIL